MKIISRRYPVPSRILAFVKFLIKTGLISRKEAWPLIAPVLKSSETQAGEPEQFRDVLNALIECELVEVTGLEKKIGFTSEVDSNLLDLKTIDETFPAIMAKQVLKERINDQKNEFAHVAAWFLNQPVSGNPSEHAGWKTKLSDQCGDLIDKANLRADENWDMLIYWLRYLGLAGRTQQEKMKGVYPDPTKFIERHFDQLLLPGEEQTIDAFIGRLGKCCPVLDGGDVFNKMRPKDQTEDVLSDSLCFSLERLTHRKVLRHWTRGDEKNFRLLADKTKVAFIKRR